MITRINRLITILLVVGIALYIVILNRESITVHLTPSNQFSSNAGVVIIVVYALGILTAALVALFFGVKAYLRERGLQYKERQRQVFFEGMLRARELLASGEWEKSKRTWEDLIKKDPTSIIARVELSRALESQGESREALRILETARTTDPKNIEVLFRAAELNLMLNNKTAAIDNLALILCHHPNQRAARMARDLSEELNRIEDALEYQRQLEQFSIDHEEHKKISSRLEFKRLVRDAGDDKERLLENLRVFVKRQPHVFEALHLLSILESEAGRIEEAAQYLVRAAKLSKEESYWNEAVQLWATHNMPERALAAARTATKETSGEARLRTELVLIRLYLVLNMLDEARAALEQFPNLARQQSVKLSPYFAQRLLILKGLALSNLGKHHEVNEIWKQLSDQSFEIKAPAFEGQAGRNGEAPSPTLSTP